MVVYNSAEQFIECGSTIKDKILRIDAIIDGLMTTAAKAASNDNITEYHLNDGQTQIKSIFRGAEAVFNSIKNFEHLRDVYIARYNKKYSGRVIRMVDSKNYTGRI